LNPSSPSDSATPGVDDTNNVEQVSINNPQSGTWTIRVNATTLVSSQIYSLVSSLLNRPTVSTRGSTSSSVHQSVTSRVFMDGSSIAGRNLDVTLSWNSIGDTLTLRAISPNGNVYTNSSSSLTTRISTGILQQSSNNGIWTIEVIGNSISASNDYTTDFTITTFANAPPEFTDIQLGGINFTSLNLNYISTCDSNEISFVMKGKEAAPGDTVINITNATINAMDYFLTGLVIPNDKQWISLVFESSNGELLFLTFVQEHPVVDRLSEGRNEAL